MEKNLNLYFDELEKMGFTYETISKEVLSNAPCGLNVINGNAYAGAMINHAILCHKIALYLLQGIKRYFDISEESIKKVCFLQHISKAIMMVPNENQWEVEKKGAIYKFAPLKGCLQAGERSILIANNNGIRFNEEEYEAMQILDKDGDDLKKLRYSMSPLTMIIEQANTIAYAIFKKNAQK